MTMIDPLTAAAVVGATAATDAVYVMFTSAVVTRKRVPGGDLEQHLVSALVFCGDQLHRKLGLRDLCRGGFLDRRLRHDHFLAPPSRRSTCRRQPGLRTARLKEAVEGNSLGRLGPTADRKAALVV